MKHEYYLIKSLDTNNTYYTNVRYYNDGNNECTNIYLIFGGKMIECINVSINMDEFDKKWYAYVNDIEYYEDCVVNKKLNRQKKETSDFLHSCFHFILKKFPFVSEYRIADMSFYNKKQMDLKNLYIIKNNKTWCQENFNAEIKNRKVWIQYLISIENLNDPAFRTKKFINYYHFKDFFYRFIENEPDSKLEIYFNETNTIRQFLQKVIENIDCQNYFKFLGTFFKNLFNVDVALNEWVFVYTPVFEIKIIQIKESVCENILKHEKKIK